MKILIPVLSLGKSGGIKVLTNLANYWTAMGIQVTILVTDQLNTPYYPVKCHLKYINGKGEVLDKNFGKKTSSFSKLYAMYIYLKKNSHNYDVVLANYNLTAYPVAFGSSTENFYYIQAYEPEFYNEMKNYIKKYISVFLAWFSYFLPLTKIVNSNMYVRHRNIFTNYVVYPGIDLNVYYPKLRGYKDNNEKFIVGCIGREELWKGSNDVAEAIKILHAEGYSNIELVVAFNKVPYENHKLVHPHGDSNLSDFYRSLDIIITPGHIQLDAIHYPVIEAMATCTPLITTGYYPSNQENCFIVDVHNPLDIADKIKYIISNYDVAIKKSKLCLKEIEQFSWERISVQFSEIILDVVKK
jgi:glycosyltransferase involved in cell wall biosynthesis